MADRHRKMIIGIVCDQYGSYAIRDARDNSREFVMIDIDSLRLQKVKETNLANIEMKHEVNYMTMADGSFRFMTQGTNIAKLARYFNTTFIKDPMNYRYMLLGIVYNQGSPVGYNVYDCQTKKNTIIKTEGGTSKWNEDVYMKMRQLGNAEWVQQAFEGFVCGWESFPRFNLKVNKEIQ